MVYFPEFNFSIANRGTFFSANLLMTVESGQNQKRYAEVRELTADWTEGNGTGGDTCTDFGIGGATYNAPDCTDNWGSGDFGTDTPYGSTVYGYMVPTIDEQTYSVDITGMVSNWLGGTNNGLVLLASGSDNWGNKMVFDRIYHC